MKLLFFDDCKLGVLKGDSVVDVSAVVEDIPHIGPHDLISGLIARFAEYKARLEEAAAKGQGVPVSRVNPAAAAEARQHRGMAVNYMEDGTRHGARADQRLPQVARARHRPGRHDGAARRAGHHLRGRGRDGGGHRQARPQRPGGRRHELRLRLHELHRRLGARAAARRQTFYQMKSRDTFAPIGPYIVTADEIADPHKLKVQLWVNGQLKQDFNTSDMAHKIPRCIEWVTSIHALEPGDILATGTNHRGLSAFQDGDMVELETRGSAGCASTCATT